MNKINFKASAITIVVLAIIVLFYDPLLSLSLVLGYLGFLGYYMFLNFRIDSLLKNKNKFIFYISIVLSFVMMALPFAVITLIKPSAVYYSGCALGFIFFKIILNILGILNKW